MRTIAVANQKGGCGKTTTSVNLSGAEPEITLRYRREYLLHQAIEKLDSRYDFCIIDCSPSLSLLTLNALVASSDVIIPLQTHYYALEGLKQLLETISIVRERFNDSLRILGVLLTFFESRTLLSQHVRRETEEYFGKLVMNTVIHRCVRLAEAPSAGEPVLTYDSRCKGAKEYMALAEEIISEEVTNEV